MRIVATSALPIDLRAELCAALPGVDLDVDVPAEGWRGLRGVSLVDADALICLLLDRVDADLLARAPKLRVIATCSVGTDHIDLAAAARAGIVVANTPDVLTEATAEFAIALMFAAARRLGEGERLVRSGAWPGWRLDQLLGMQLAGKTLGIIGMGRIGRAVARRADALGMRVSFAGRDQPVEPIFERADVLSLHCPLTAATRNLVDADRLARMQRHAILINTARGGCVDESALADALERGAIAGAGLDVFAHEPAIDPTAPPSGSADRPAQVGAIDPTAPPSGSADRPAQVGAIEPTAPPSGSADRPAQVGAIEPRLLAHPRVVLAPHLGSATTETRRAMAQLCADAVIAVLAGRAPAHQVRRG